MIKFNSPFDPIKVEPKDTSERCISGDYLDYNEYGKVVVKHGNPVDIMAISEAAKEGTELSDQIANLIKSGDLSSATLKESDCADVSEAPECVSQMLQQNARAVQKANEAEKQLSSYGLGVSGKDLAKMTDEEVTKVLNEYIQKRLDEKKGSNEDVKQ